MSDWSEQEEDLFCEALSRTHPAKRTAFLDQTCAGKPVLRARVEEMLAVHAEAEKFFSETKLATCFLMENIKNNEHCVSTAFCHRHPLPETAGFGGHVDADRHRADAGHE